MISGGTAIWDIGVIRVTGIIRAIRAALAIRFLGLLGIFALKNKKDGKRVIRLLVLSRLLTK